MLTPYLTQNAHTQGDLCVIDQASNSFQIQEPYSPETAAELVLIRLAGLKASLLEITSTFSYIILHSVYRSCLSFQ